MRQALADSVASPILFAVTLFIGLVIRLVGIPGEPRLPFWFELAVALIGNLVLLGSLLLVTRVLARQPKIPLVFVYTSVIFAGVLRGFAVQVLLNIVGTSLSSMLTMRLVSSSAIFSVTIFAAAYSIHVTNSRLKFLATLRSAQNTLKKELEENQDRIDSWYYELVSGVKSELTDALDKSRKLDSIKLSTALKSLVEDYIRPISHNFAEEKPTYTPSEPSVLLKAPTLEEAIRRTRERTWRAHPMAISFAVLLATAAVFIQFSRLSNWGYYFAAITLTYLGFLLSNQILKRLKTQTTLVRRTLEYFAITITLEMPATVVALDSFRLLRGFGSIWQCVLLASGVALASFMITLSVMIPKLIQEDQEELEIANAELKWLIARAKSQMWVKQRELSTHLHGAVQSGISAAAIRFDLDRLNGVEDEISRNRAIEKTKKSIDSISRKPPTNIRLSSELNKIHRGWAGVCAVEISADEQLLISIEKDQTATRALLDIVHEVVANAINHGNATNVDLYVDNSNSGLLEVHALNNGKRLSDFSKPGLGATVLDECTTHWEIFNTSRGVQFKCSIPTTFMGIHAG